MSLFLHGQTKFPQLRALGRTRFSPALAVIGGVLGAVIGGGLGAVLGAVLGEVLREVLGVVTGGVLARIPRTVADGADGPIGCRGPVDAHSRSWRLVTRKPFSSTPTPSQPTRSSAPIASVSRATSARILRNRRRGFGW